MHNAPLDMEVIRAAGALVRGIHDASAGLAVPNDWEVLLPAEEPDLLCHNDLATWNLIIDHDRLVFIDWDGAGPSTRLWDLAYSAISFGHLFPESLVSAAAARLVALLDGYEADDRLREALPKTMTNRAAAMHEMLQRAHESAQEPWATMYTEGHGDHWLGTTKFIARHNRDWQDAVTHNSTH
jgi:Ser/Thr protein kinase RdoA (MazF antagonist)